jgi:hypothetical protein
MRRNKVLVLALGLWLSCSLLSTISLLAQSYPRGTVSLPGPGFVNALMFHLIASLVAYFVIAFIPVVLIGWVAKRLWGKPSKVPEGERFDKSRNEPRPQV